MDKLYIPGDLVYIHGSLRIISNFDGYYATYYDENESLQEVYVNAIEGIPIRLCLQLLHFLRGWFLDSFLRFFT